MKKQILTMTAAVILTLPMIGVCQSDGNNTSVHGFSGQNPGEPQKIYRKFTATVNSVDNDGRVDVTTDKNQKLSVKINGNSKITKNNGQSGDANDLGPGKRVDVEIVKQHGQPDTIVSVDVK